MNTKNKKNYNLFVDSNISDVANRSIMITGVARSGTTLTGNIVHSFKGVEYVFEPHALAQMFNNRELFNTELWKYHFEHYLYEDILVPMLAGRSLNFNSNDWSYIFNAKSCEEIRDRFDKVQRIREMTEQVKEHRVAVKLTNVVADLPFLEEEYPAMKKVVVIRNPDEIVPSMMNRGWFLNEKSTYLNDGSVRDVSGVLLPYFISPERASEWKEMMPIDRCYACYIDCYNTKFLPTNVIILDYRNILTRPEETVKMLAARIECGYGDLTNKIISEIKPQKSTQKINPQESVLRDAALELYDNIRKSSL